jgi:predicted transcriptional regulator
MNIDAKQMTRAVSVDDIEDLSEFYRPHPDFAIIEFIKDNPGSGACDIAKAISLSCNVTSRHVHQLELDGILRSEWYGRRKSYYYGVP